MAYRVKGIVTTTVFFMALSASVWPAHASTLAAYDVNLDTAGLNATAGQIAFDLINGDNTLGNNTLTISSFSTNGMLSSGGNVNTAGASGDLPGVVTITDAEFFNESLRDLTFGTAMAFDVALTTSFAGPGTPDQYSTFLIRAEGSTIETDDPTGSNALFAIDLDGTPTGHLTVYNSLTPNVSWTVTPSGGDTTPPSVVNVSRGRNAQGFATLTVVFQDIGSGLQSIDVINSVNCTVDVPSFTPGTTDQVTVVATSTSKTASSRVSLRATDVAGNVR